MQVREVDVAEALELDLVWKPRLHDRRELRLGERALLELVQRMVATLLCRALKRHAEHAGVCTHVGVPARERLPQWIRQDTAEVGDDRAELAHAAAGAGSRTVSS